MTYLGTRGKVTVLCNVVDYSVTIVVDYRITIVVDYSITIVIDYSITIVVHYISLQCSGILVPTV